MRSSLFYLVKALGDLYLLAFLLRFLLQWVRADFYNPFTQAIVQITNPLVRPASRFIPTSRNMDVPTLAVLVLLEGILTWLLLRIGGVPSGTLAPLPLLIVFRLVSLALWFYSVSILVYVILSWVGPRTRHPIAVVLADLNEPILRPARRLIPTIAGLDLSPLLVLILVQGAFRLLPLPSYLS